jgi:HrpA-like RNA helicase
MLSVSEQKSIISILKTRSVSTRFYEYGGIKFLEQHLLNNANSSVYQPTGKQLLITSSTGSGKTTNCAEFLAILFLSNIDSDSTDINANANDDTNANANNNAARDTTHVPVIITVPQRNSARLMSQYLNRRLPKHIFGYAIQGEKYIPLNCKVLFVTTGWCRAQLLNNKHFSFKVFVLDEAHHRCENTDIVKRSLKRMIHNNTAVFDLIISSATISEEYFKESFDKLVCFTEPCEVGYKNDIIYESDYMLQRMLTENVFADPVKTTEGFMGITKQILKIMRSHSNAGILVFLPGEESIESLIELLRDMPVMKRFRHCTKIAPLYGALSQEEQDDAMTYDCKRDDYRIIVCSDICESSITIDGITHVIDSGFKKNMYLDDEGRQSLICEPCSRSSSMQRRGRGMRTVVLDKKTRKQIQGYTVFMMSESDFKCRSELPPNEIDINPLFNPLLYIIGSTIGKTIDVHEFFHDIMPLRIDDALQFLLQHQLITKYDQDQKDKDYIL